MPENTSEELVKKHRERFSISAVIPEKFPYDLECVRGNCENIVGYVPVPLGVAGPLSVDDCEINVPLSTTEGALVASVNRGCKLLQSNGGVRTVLVEDGMTRGPVLKFPDIKHAHEMSRWLSSEEGFALMRQVFDQTSRYARLTDIKVKQAGRYLYLRLKATTGDAMGMNMVGKGTEAALQVALELHPQGELLSLSGNYCVDKKASALNWIEGRGKSVVAEAIISPRSIRDILHCLPDRLINVHQGKCMIGSALSAGPGNNNAHAANVVAAIYLATGQDLAQVCDSSFCLTYLEAMANGDIHASVTMPCVQIGCVGGGTGLPPQQASLAMLTGSEHNAARAARAVAAAVLAGELSLLGSLAEGSLMNAHLSLNRR